MAASASISASVERLAVQRHLPAEREHRLGAEQARHQRVLAVPATAAVLERWPAWSGRAPGSAATARRRRARRSAADTVSSSETSSSVSRVISSGTRSSSSRSSDRPGLRRRAQRDARRGCAPVRRTRGPPACRPTAAPRRRGGAGRARRGPAAPAAPTRRPAPPRRPRPAARSVTSAGQPGGRRGASSSGSQPRRTRLPAPAVAADRRAARQGVDDRGQQLAHLGLGPAGGRPPVVRRLGGQPAYALVLGRLERREPPARRRRARTGRPRPGGAPARRPRPAAQRSGAAAVPSRRPGRARAAPRGSAARPCATPSVNSTACPAAGRRRAPRPGR